MPERAGSTCPRVRRCWHQTEHVHAVERSSVTVFFTPEIDGQFVTIKAGWAADDGHSTCPWPTKEDAMAWASKAFGVTWP